MSTNSVPAHVRPIWTPADAAKAAEDAAKHKPVRLRDWLWAPVLIAAAILLPGLTAPPAQADGVDDAVALYGIPVVCDTIDEYPSADGVAGVALALIDEGFTPTEAGEIVATSVIAFCPEHLVDVQAFINEYASKGQIV
ncbi:hypothetical protein I5J50_gp45 [Mycobacterium phage Purky]|uniref:DUF732 domain-containing protein n=1 Tax=Mycobacterium phage Purky TaxID=2593351 RepID=A0A514TWS3_9CAUD|nr:hypothetical protein I5J50_gp45 [Mycobacterium phage Purky]QDK01149.1 hypothetical protein SEA_PURKY_45 [Mycobacterium phage Purky]